MDYLYVFIKANDWEDIIIFLSKEDAKNQSKNTQMPELKFLK